MPYRAGLITDIPSYSCNLRPILGYLDRFCIQNTRRTWYTWNAPVTVVLILNRIMTMFRIIRILQIILNCPLSMTWEGVYILLSVTVGILFMLNLSHSTKYVYICSSYRLYVHYTSEMVIFVFIQAYCYLSVVFAYQEMGFCFNYNINHLLNALPFFFCFHYFTWHHATCSPQNTV